MIPKLFLEKLNKYRINGFGLTRKSEKLMKKQHWSALLCGRSGVRSLTFVGGVALHATSIYVVMTVLPLLINDLGGERYYAWVATVFLIASLIGASFATTLLRKMGPRGAYTISALIFTLGTFLSSIAPTMPLFLAGRFIQGLGSGSLLSLSYSLVRIIIDPSLWSRALGIISGVWGVSMLVGPAIGGISVQYGAWRVSIWIVGFLAIIFALIAFKVLPKENENHIPQYPLPLSQLFVLVSLICIMSSGDAIGTTSARIFGLIIGVSLLFLLAKIELSASYPIFPPKTFSVSSEFFPIYSLILVVTAVAYAVELYFPLFLQILHKSDAMTAGYISILMGFGWTCGALLGAGLSPKKIRRIVVCSPLFCLLGMSILLWLIPRELSTARDTSIICLTLFLTGIASGVAWPHLLTRILQCAGDTHALRASESFTSVQLFSTALSATLTGIITNLSGLFNPGGIEGTIFAARVLLITLIGLLLCFGIPLSLRISHKMLHNLSEQPNGSMSITRS